VTIVAARPVPAPVDSAATAVFDRSTTAVFDRLKNVPFAPQLNWSNSVVYVTFVLVFVVFAFALQDKGFVSEYNLLNVLRQSVPIAIMTIGFVFVLSAGEIDWSIGSTVAMSAVVSAMVLREHGFWLGVGAGLGTGVIIGLVNGLMVTKLRLPSFLVTLATLSLVAGLAATITNTTAIPVVDTSFIAIFGGGSIGPVSSLYIWLLIVSVVAAVVFYQTRFGAHVRAMGDNRAAAANVGIRTDRLRIAVFLITSITAALVGMLYAGQLRGAQYTIGNGNELSVISAAIIGGSSLYGGRGSIFGAVVGALLLATLNNGLILFGLSVSAQQTALGAILLIAITISLREKREA
jgi:ribose transport system permease protein